MTQAHARFIVQIVAHMDIIQINAPCGTQQRIRKHGATFAAFTGMKHIHDTANSTNHCTQNIVTYARISDIGQHTHARNANHHRQNPIDFERVLRLALLKLRQNPGFYHVIHEFSFFLRVGV